MTWTAVSIGMTMAAASLPGAAVPPFGIYGGDLVRLDLSAAGGRLETGCAAGTIEGPVAFDAHGRFVAAGSLESFSPGPQAGDAAPLLARVRYTGELSGGELTLTVDDPKAAPLVLRMQHGRRSKVIRCL